MREDIMIYYDILNGSEIETRLIMINGYIRDPSISYTKSDKFDRTIYYDIVNGS
jgi:hypothetical protein